jgi:LPXTG-motif cell wall-anchored protein
VPYTAMFGSSLALMGLILGFIYSVSGGSPGLAVYSHPGPTKFHLDYPAAWTPQELDGKDRLGISMTIFFLPDNAKNRFFVVGVPKALLAQVPDPRSIFFAGPIESTSKDGAWERARIRWQGEEALTWQKDDGAERWILAGVAFPKDFPLLEPEFEKVQASWATGGAKPGSEAPSEGKYTVADRAIEGATFAWIGLALLAAGAILFTRKRSRPPWLAASALFVFVAGTYWTLVQLPTFAYTVFGASSRDAWPQLTDGSLDVAAAAVTVLAVAIPRLHRYLGALAALDLGLFAVYWLDRAISTGLQAGRLSIVAAVMVLGALLWEVAMSGEAITNRHNRHFPRHTRVMVYLGYLLAVASAVLFFSSVKTAEGSVEPLFESENFSDTGLLFLGVAFVVTMFLLRAMRVAEDGVSRRSDLRWGTGTAATRA